MKKKKINAIQDHCGLVIDWCVFSVAHKETIGVYRTGSVQIPMCEWQKLAVAKFKE